ncbi:MAG: YigZ family protein [Lachnospiraceae bacterium]|nr:YigZ family protein [Lachnospiraceae bacterium]
MSNKIIIEGGSGEIVEKKSRFIATVKAVETEEEAIAFINEMKKKYWDARHNCMAYIVNDIKRFSDDGEPQGTAGKPILDVLEGKNISNGVIVVTRYFGGILLGTGGLVRAYQKSAIEGLENSVIAEKCNGYISVILTDYNGLGKIQYIASNEGINLIDIMYTDNVTIKFVSLKDEYNSFVNKVIEATAGKAQISDRNEIDFYKTENGIHII